MVIKMMNPINNPIDLAKICGQPIDDTLPVPEVISSMCEIDSVEFGEDVYYFSAYDSGVDVVYTAGDNGEVTSIKKSPEGATVLPLVGVQSQLVYITLNELQHVTSDVSNKDLTALARKKAQITREMDSLNVRNLFDLCLGLTAQEVELTTGDDIYSGIMSMVHKIADYADNYILFCGTTVWEKINTYERDMETTFAYRLGIKEMLKDFGIKVVKISGSTVAQDTTSDSRPVLSATKAILVGTKSVLGGKPALFVTRKMNPEIAKQIGLPVEGRDRLLATIGGLQVLNNAKNILGVGMVGYESRAIAIINPLAICFCDELTNPA